MAVLYLFPIKGLGNVAFSYPFSPSTLVIDQREALLW